MKNANNQYVVYDEQGQPAFIGSIVEALTVANFVVGVSMHSLEADSSLNQGE